MKKELKEMILLFSCICIIFITSSLAMANHDDEIKQIKEEEKITKEVVKPKEETKTQEEVVENIEEETKKVKSFTGLLLGFDKSNGLTDVVMLANFDVETNKVKLISVPRDLQVDFRSELFKDIKEANPKIRINYCKLTEAYYYLGKDNEAIYEVKKIVSRIVGIDIDYIATINVNGFKEVVDAVGGVEFYVPQRMYYSDPMQNLYINLYEGQQLLDGNKAEQLVRFRKYNQPDIQRIKVQQDFILALYQKVSAIRDYEKIVDLVSTVYDIVDSDFGLLFVLDYAEYFFNLDTNNLLQKENMLTVDSYGKKIDKIWYQLWDVEKVHEEVEELLNK